MTNALIDFDCPFIVSPYIGGGIGYARTEGKGKGIRGSHGQLKAENKLTCNDFAWQAIIGIKYLTCLNWETSLEYRYFKVKNVGANHKIGAALTKFF